MRTNLFKSLLVAVMAIGAMGGVKAEETKTLVYSNDFETSSDFTKTGKDGGHFLNPGTTTLNSFGSQVIAAGGAGGDQGLMSPQFNIGDAKIVDIELKFKMDGCCDQKGSGLYFITAKNTSGWNTQKSIFSISAKAAGNGTWGTITAGGVDIKNKIYSVGTNNHEFSMNGNRGTTGVAKLNLRINFTTQQAIFTLSRTNGDVLIEEQKVPFENESNSLYGLFVHGGKSFGGNYVDDLKVWTVTSTEVTKTADYTIKYICEGQEIKKSLKYTGIVGEEISIKNSDKEDFYNENNSIKYIYVSDDAALKTVAEDGSTVVTITYRAANKFNYIINAVDELNNKLQELGNGSSFEGEASRTYYPKAINVEGKWYVNNGKDSYPTYAIDVNTAGTYNITYSVQNLAYYSDVENLNTSKAFVASGDYPERYSGGKVGRLGAGAYTYTNNFEETKTYTLYLWARNKASNAANITIGLRDGEGMITELDNKFEDWKGGKEELKSVSDITIPAGSALVLKNPADGWNSNLEMDYIYLVEQMPATETVSVSEAGYATYATTNNIVVPEGNDVEVMTVTVNKDNSTITPHKVAANTVIPANTGILVKAAQGDYNFAVTSEASKGLPTNNLVAATKAVTSYDAKYKYFALTKLSDGKVGFAVVKEGVNIPAGKAYLMVEKGSAAKFFGLDGEATGINSVKTAKADGAYYTLEGVKTTKPVKGIYIHNGKKIVVK